MRLAFFFVNAFRRLRVELVELVVERRLVLLLFLFGILLKAMKFEPAPL